MHPESRGRRWVAAQARKHCLDVLTLAAKYSTTVGGLPRWNGGLRWLYWTATISYIVLKHCTQGPDVRGSANTTLSTINRQQSSLTVGVTMCFLITTVTINHRYRVTAWYCIVRTVARAALTTRQHELCLSERFVLLW